MPPPPSSVEQTPFQTGAARKGLLLPHPSQQVIVLGGADTNISHLASSYCCSGRDGEVWPGCGSSLPLPQLCLWDGGFTLGRALLEYRGLMTLTQDCKAS